MERRHILATASVFILAVAATAAAPSTALAEEAGAPAPALVQTTEFGTLLYAPEFFASYRPNTAYDMVNRVPGFSVDDGEQSRGFEGAVGNVLVNGSRPASKNDTPSSVLGRIVAGKVERIELIRGGAPGIEMQGYSVVVNVILKDTASTEQILSHNSFIYDGGRSLFGGSYQLTHRSGENTWGLFLSDSISSSDSIGTGPYLRYGPDGQLQRREHFDNQAYGGGNAVRGTFKGPVLGGMLDVTARYGVNDWVNSSLQTSDTVKRESYSGNDGTSGEVGVTYTRAINPRIKSETRMIHEFSTFESVDRSNLTLNGTAEPEQLFRAEGDSSESIVRSLMRFQKSERLEFEAGGEVAYNMLQIDQAYSIGGNNIPLPSASVKVEEVRGELFGKGTWRFNPKWTLEAGLRLEHSTISQSGDADNEASFFFAKPRLQLTWTPRESTQLRMRFERTVGQLDFNDFAASTELATDNVMGGNVNLSPEHRWVSEVSFEQRFLKEGIFSISYRHDAISDAIDVIPLDDGLSAVGNIGDATLDQLKVSFAVPTDRFFLPGGKLSFENTWNKTEVTDPTTGRKRPISDVRPTDAQISLEQNIPSKNVSWGISWLPRMSQHTYTPDYVAGWDGKDYYQLWVEYKPVPSLSIRAQINTWDSFYWQREVYADRDSRPVAFTEIRDIAPRSIYQLRVRKTF